jgi:hypothetical protein
MSIDRSDQLARIDARQDEIERRAAEEWAQLDGRNTLQRVQDDLKARQADPEWMKRVQAEWDAIDVSEQLEKQRAATRAQFERECG